jgi:hypothetical protein
MVMLIGAVISLGIMQIICVLGLFWGLVELRAMQRSTHSIQYVPADQGFERVTDSVKEALSKDLFDNVQ